MPKTRRELVFRALRNLGVLPQGQVPSDEEFDSVNDLVVPVLEDLSARNICFVPDFEAIDDEKFLALGHILADRMRSEFGAMGSSPEVAEIAALATKAELDLKEQFRIATREPLRAMRSDFYPRARKPRLIG